MEKNFELLIKELSNLNIACDMAIEKENGEITIAVDAVDFNAKCAEIYKKAVKIGLEEIRGENTKQTFEICGGCSIFDNRDTEIYIYHTIYGKIINYNKISKVFSSYIKNINDKETLSLLKSIKKDIKKCF